MSSKSRRQFKRYPRHSDIDLKFRGMQFKARMIDYSLSGVGAVVDAADPEIRAAGKVVWSKSRKSWLVIGIEIIGELKGLIKDFRLSDTLIGLRRSKKTGVLTFETGGIVKRVYLKNGDTIFSASDRKEDRLGELLLRERRITIEQYDRFMTEVRKAKQRQGAILVRLGYLTPQELFKLVKHQAEEIILDLFSVQEGAFLFKETPLPAEEAPTLKLSVANLIYYGTKRIKDLHRLESILPSTDGVISLSDDPLDLFQDLRLDNSGKTIITYADGKTTLEEIILISQLDKPEALKTVCALLDVRIITIKAAHGISHGMTSEQIAEEMSEEKEREIDVSLKDEIVEIHKNYKSLGFYGVLGLESHASIHEIKIAYYKAAKKFHPDMHQRLADEVLKDKLSDIFSYVYEAYATLSDPTKKKRYDEAATVKPAQSVSNSDRAKELFEEGKVQLRRNNLPAAEQLFGKAVYLEGATPEYHYYYGLTLMKENIFRAAEKSISRALELDPQNAKYLAELGFVYLGLGFPKRAAAFFRKALKISPGHTRASEGMLKIR
jgi:tetratricopeptide (TPR) repeat protein